MTGDEWAASFDEAGFSLAGARSPDASKPDGRALRSNRNSPGAGWQPHAPRRGSYSGLRGRWGEVDGAGASFCRSAGLTVFGWGAWELEAHLRHSRQGTVPQMGKRRGRLGLMRGLLRNNAARVG